jgi:hypothetical protein
MTTDINRGWGGDTGQPAGQRCFLLTSTLLSSDPALLRRPRFPAQNMQYQRLDAHTRPGVTCLPPRPPARQHQVWGRSRGSVARLAAVQQGV